ncbi:hypothetical protein PVK06_001295 [Gossypium arboreum]|uniref:Serine/threonine-protein phosphatase 7 long form homolog n=1 Tax=Gossypium arboreum TaxID=29729 RepID=A0ABR0R0Q0_GOSAR|nr:hypothetical protein PVK06_001295 [Gossypium arboreum]
MLYRELFRTTDPSAMDIGRCLILQQSWALYQMPFLASIIRLHTVYPDTASTIGGYPWDEQEGAYRNNWGEVHEEYITMWNNRLGRVPQMDRALDLPPSLEYIQWYCEIGKPFLFGGRSMVVPPYTIRIGQPFSDSHHAPEPEPKLHAGDSSYHPDLGGNNYFPGSSGHRYHSEFDIFSPLPH